ncbi:MAG TPA: AAA family ATPase [Azospirillum sp.]|nr:AAA family ATPase [Azospirillum sp.]
MEHRVTGAELRVFREERRMNQPDFAAAINARTGRAYDKGSVSRWENGRAPIPEEVAAWVHEAAAVQPAGIPARVGPAVVTAVANQKGGVGKTAVAVNLAYALAKAGRKVLLIDCDPQGSATIHLGVPPHELEQQSKTLTHVLGRDVAAEAAIVPVLDGLFDLLGSSIVLAEVEVGLLADATGTGALTMREKIGEVCDLYDHIVLDCPPNLGLLSASALNASDRVLVPSQAEMLSVLGIPLLVGTVAKVRRRVNPKLKILGIVPTQVHRRSQDAAMMAQLEAAAAQHGLRLFPPIRDSKVYPDSVTEGIPALAVRNAVGADVFTDLVGALQEVEAEKKEGVHVQA